MTRSQLKTIKAGLLCYGLRVDDSAVVELIRRNPYAFEQTLVHAAHIVINGVVINVCLVEKFCQSSPYYITYKGRFVLWNDEIQLCDVDIIEMPDWCNEEIHGYRIGDYIRPHSNNCLSCTPIFKCGYNSIGKTCKFCSLNSYYLGQIKNEINPKILAKMISRIMAYKVYDLNFSAGTFLTEDKSVGYYLSVLKELKRTDIDRIPFISLEITPPDKNIYIQELVNNGVTALIMNIEIAKDSLRKEICPGKAEVSIERYFNAMEYAVRLLGRGNVSSVLLAGIQPAKDIISMGIKLLDIGVIPTVMPFKPLDHCEMSNHETTNPEELLYINDILSQEIIKSGLDPCSQRGCTRCGGCSLESIEFENR